MSPGLVGDNTAPQRRPVPARRIVAAGQRGEAFIAGGITAEIEVVEIERTGKAFDLDFRGLRLGLAEIAEHPRSHQRHDQADDGDDYEDFDQREAGLPPSRPTATSCLDQYVSIHLSRLLAISRVAGHGPPP